ncbi:hypothetical protein Q4I28_008283 [Leishmania naiffi]|uniref:Uncharacterized protein n=1 Tax=Leishmania naiffi TaxID=5678 RepID=A0AAW3B5B8_9TRYP
MPALPAAKGKGAPAASKKKVRAPEPCGCGVDTYRPPPKGKRTPAVIVHNPGCVYQRTTCGAYPHLTCCTTCQEPCRFCLGQNRWCPHCYERRCAYQYKRVVMGAEPLTGADMGPGKAEVVASLPRRGTSRRRTTVRLVDKKHSTPNLPRGPSALLQGTHAAVS